MNPAIRLAGVGKTYRTYAHARDRFWEMLTGRPRYRETVALHPLDLRIDHGEVVGIIGMNGAGKSTLLKLIAGTVPPDQGDVEVSGPVCALLELGAGFHPEMSGRDNIFLGAAVAGLSASRIKTQVDEIIDFAGLRKSIDQPVKTYSSGMMMRLAFSVATAVDPDLLILDETLSVGDGAFARKSFQRIMQFKEAGKTILFCSHSMYQIQAICSRAIWIDQGELKMDGNPGAVVAAYNDYLGLFEQAAITGVDGEAKASPLSESPGDGVAESGVKSSVGARLLKVMVRAGEFSGIKLPLTSGCVDLAVAVSFQSDPALKPPSVGVTITASSGVPVTSAGTHVDGMTVKRGEDGRGEVELQFPKLPLLQGSYWVNVFLLCDRGLQLYDKAQLVSELEVSQKTLEMGVVTLPHQWSGVVPAGQS
jgi:lipopolysaccharide transport system ATP-binding protein